MNFPLPLLWRVSQFEIILPPVENLEEPTKAYHPMLSYQVIKYIGAVLLLLGQLVTLNKVYSIYFTNGNFLNSTGANVLSTLGQMGLPLIMIGTIAAIMRHRKRIYAYLIAYALGAASFIFIEQIGVTGYLYFVLKTANITIDDEVVTLVKDLVVTTLNQFTSLNVFVDLFLCACFYFFLFHAPKKHVKLFRCFVALPAAYLVAGYIITVINKFGAADFDIFILYLLPSKKPSVYVIVLAMLLYLKIFSANKEVPDISSKSFAVFMSFVIVFVCIIDAFLSCLPDASNFCVGGCYLLFTCIPFVLLFDYKAEIKHRWISWTMPAFYVVSYGTLLFFYTVIVVDVLEKFSELSGSFA